MDRLALFAQLRSLARHKLHSALNIGGLAVGIAVFLILGLYVRFELTYENWLPDHAKIYLVQTRYDAPGSPFNGTYPNTMGGLLEELKAEYPGTLGTRIRPIGGAVIRGATVTKETVSQVDPNFLNVIPLPMIAGGERGTLLDPTSALISEGVARRYFPGGQAVGRPLSLNIGGSVNAYRVAGVFRDLPRNTELDFSILTPLPSKAPNDNWYRWGSSSLYTYLRFDTPGEAARYAGRLTELIARRAVKDLGPSPEKMMFLELKQISAVHLNSSSRRMTVVTLGLVGTLTLLIAIVNYVNLATASAGLRAREVAMRKVLGASFGALVKLYLGEAIAITALAAIIGLMLAELGRPFVNAAGGLSLTIPYATVAPSLFLLTLVVGLLAGFYPAIVLARFPAAGVLSSSRAPGGGRAAGRAREMLVMFQFALATAFMIGTAVLVMQTRHVRTADLGFRRAALLVVPSFKDAALDRSQRATLLASFAGTNGVADVSVANTVPGDESNISSNNLSVPGRAGDGPSLQSIRVGQRFFETIGAHLVAGRLFESRYGLDDASNRNPEDARNIIINRRAVSALGFASPQAAIGKTVGGTLSPRTIVGVVEDMRFYSPRKPLSAATYEYAPQELDDGLAVIRVVGDPRAAIGNIRGAWRRLAPNVPFEAITASQNLQTYYDADDRASRLFGIGSGLAVLIGCIGLWGLASFNTSRRVQEIGIRKVLGASSKDIVRLLVGQFLRPVLIASIVAWPLAFFAMRTWLAGFDDKIALSPIYFVGATVLAITIAVLTVLAQSLRASRATPSWALRHE